MRGRELPMEDPVRRLAEAYAIVVTGCTKTTLARELRDGKLELPWVIGFRDTVVHVAEPWSHLHALHRHKRGFSAMRDRLGAIVEMVEATSRPSEIRVEIWSDDGTFDDKLCLELARVVGRPVELFPPDRITEALSAVRRGLTAEHVRAVNPLLAVLSWVSAVEHDTPGD